MTTPFKITTKKPEDKCLEIDVTKHGALVVPGHILIGVTSKQTKVKKLSEHYFNTFMSNNPRDMYFRYFLSEVLKNAKEQGILYLTGVHRYSDLIKESLTEFIENNYETLSMISGYVLDGAEQRANAEGASAPEGMPEMPMVGGQEETVEFNGMTLRGQGIGRLTQDDLAQITALMNEQQIGMQPVQSNSDITDVEVKELKND